MGAMLLVLAYTLFEMRHLIRGPMITIEYPASGSVVTDSLIELKGKTKNVTRVSLNDRPIFVDASGNLYEELLLANGYNLIRIWASDRFGRSTAEELQIILVAPPTSPQT